LRAGGSIKFIKKKTNDGTFNNQSFFENLEDDELSESKILETCRTDK
jgi:hypothetical protein